MAPFFIGTEPMATQLHFPSPHEALQYALDRHARGEYQLAADIYQTLLEQAQPGTGQAEIQRLLGLTLTQLGRAQEGLPLLQAAVQALPESSFAHLHHGLALHHLGRYEEAISAFERAYQLNPKEPAALINWAAALIALAKPQEAVTIAEKSVALAPGSADARHNLGLALIESNRDPEALPHLQEAVRIQPHFPDAWMHLGLVYRHLGRIDDALIAYQEAHRQNPADANTAVNLADLWVSLGMSAEAEDLYRQVLARDAQHVGARMGLAALLTEAGKNQEALALLSDLPIPARRAEQVTLQKLGILLELEQKEAARALLATIPPQGATYLRATFSLLDKEDPARRDLAERLERALAEDPQTPFLEQVRSHFVLADYWHEAKEFDRAFPHYQQGHELLRAHEPFQAEVHQAQIDRLIRHFDAQRLQQGPFGSSDSTLVFIVGMPRSGTSLLEQILDSHSQVYGSGERTEMSQLMAQYMAEVVDAALPRIWDAKRWQTLANQHLQRLRKEAGTEVRYITDKLPANFMNLGLIALLFPNAKILYTVRDPMDNCLSIYQNNFRGRHGYQHDLRALAFYYQEHRRLMDHWQQVLGERILTVSYEQVVRDFDGEIGKVLAFLDLPWEESCRRFYENPRIVQTASKDQVTRPLYQSSLQRWRHYEKYLGELKSSLEI